MRGFILGLILAGLCTPNYAGNLHTEESRSERTSTKVQRGIITIKQAKTTQPQPAYHPRVRKTVVRVTSASPVTVSTSKSKAAPVRNAIVPTPATTGSVLYQYAPNSYSFTPIVGYRQLRPKYAHHQQQTPLTYHTPIVYAKTKASTGHYQNPHLQKSYMTPPPIFTYYVAEPPPVETPVKPTKTQSTPTVYYAQQQSPTKKLVQKVKKVAVANVAVGPPTVTYHGYKPQQYEIAQPQLYQTVQTAAPEITYYQQLPVATPQLLTKKPYYANAGPVYPIHSYATDSSRYGGAPLTKLRPSGLGISYSPVGPGIASYNFQGFGVQYGY